MKSPGLEYSMRGELVALDLETTGFDPNLDAIIEVGLVRIRDGEIVEEGSKLVNPDRPIPEVVTQLTSIRNDMVLDQPPINAVLPWIRAFVGNAPVIGHNVGFDLGFLNRHGILQNNLRIDTYDLASILMPRAARYTLSSLSSDIQVDLENAHRALDDARATALLYLLLWQKTIALPVTTLQEIISASQGLEWDVRHILEAALREHNAIPQSLPTSDREIMGLFGESAHDEKALRANELAQPIDVGKVAAMIDEDGAVAKRLSGYEYRSQQVEMTRLVAEAFDQSQHVMIEAGTGTGKSIAYLLPSIIWATTNQDRVVVSTNTINLQDQLIFKDIPALAAAMDTPFKAAVLKGRGNYLCPRRLIATRRRHATQVDELRTLAKILVWLLESSSGDKGEITLRGPVENNTWQRMSAEDEGCTLDRCRTVMAGKCPFYKARKAAEAAHILVVNHALLLSDAVSENHVLPDYRHLVLDEAHHLEEATTNGLSFRLDEALLNRRLADLGGPKKGLLGDLMNNVESNAPEKEAKRLEAFVKNISAATGAMEVHIGTLFGRLRDFFSDITGDRSSDYLSQIRLTPELRNKNSFAQVQDAWRTLKEFFEVIGGAMRRLGEVLARLEQYHISDYDDLVNSIKAAARYLDEVKTQLEAFTVTPDDNAVYWINVGQNIAYLSLQSAPLHVGPMVEKYLWNAKDSVVMTSATLRANENFSYIQQRLDAQSIQTEELGSPFDYKKSTLIYVPDDMPEPNDRHHYQKALERGIIGLADALNGRVLVLFTSYTQLRQTAEAIRPLLALGNISVYDQSDGSSRQALLDGFKASEKAVLLGTKSFWEGIDIPGDSLSALVITRLPFAVPTDPIFAARSETYSDSFKEYALPDAILRFRQGFGRLIRTKTDRGVVAIFDRRVLSKSYGGAFLDALPDCTIERGALKNLPDKAKSWIEG
jgi:ATP-dependent DNA helicase DinG